MRVSLVLLCAAVFALSSGQAWAESGTYTPPKNYTGNIWVDITVPADVQTGCFQVIWGPWIGSGCAARNSEGKFELKFQKNSTDQVPFTVVYPSGSIVNQVLFQSWDPCPNVPPSGCRPVPLSWRAR